MLGQELDRGNGDLRGDRCYRLLKAYGEATTAIQPFQRSSYDPAAGENDKAFGRIGTLLNLDGPFADPPEGTPEFVTGLAAISEDLAHAR